MMEMGEGGSNRESIERWNQTRRGRREQTRRAVGRYTVGEESNKWDTLVRRVVGLHYVWRFRTVSVVSNDDEMMWSAEHNTSCHDNVAQQGRESNI